MAGAVGILAVVCDVLFMDETLPKLEGQSALVGVYVRLGGSAADVTGGGAHAANGGAGHGGPLLGTPAAPLRGPPWALLPEPHCRVFCPGYAKSRMEWRQAARAPRAASQKPYIRRASRACRRPDVRLGSARQAPTRRRGGAERDVEANATEPLLAQPSATQAMAANYAPDIAPPVSGAAEGLASAADGLASAVGLNGNDDPAGAHQDGRPRHADGAPADAARPADGGGAAVRSPFAGASAPAPAAGAAPDRPAAGEEAPRRDGEAGGAWAAGPPGSSPPPAWGSVGGRRESFGGRRESLGGRSPSGAAGHAFHFGRLGGSPRDAPGAGVGVGLGAVGRRSSIGGGETVMQRSLSVTSDTATLLGPFDREAFRHADRQLGAHGAGRGAAQHAERSGGNEEAVAEDEGEGSEGSAPVAKWHQIPNVRPCVCYAEKHEVTFKVNFECLR